MFRKIKFLFGEAFSKSRASILILGGFLMGFGEMMTVGAIVPVLSNLGAQNSVTISNQNISLTTEAALIIFLVIIFLKTAYGLVFIYFQSKFVFESIGKLSEGVLYKYLSSGIKAIYGDNHAGAVRNVFNETNLLGIGVFLPITIIFSELSVAFLLIILLYFLYFDFLFVLALAVFIYLLLVWMPLRDQVYRFGEIRQKAEKQRLELTFSTLRMVPEIQTSNSIRHFISNYSVHTASAISAMAKFWYVRQMPKLSFELILLSSFFFSYHLFGQFGYELEVTISSLGIAAVAAFRLIPAATRILSSISSIKYNVKTIDELYGLVRGHEGIYSDQKTLSAHHTIPDIPEKIILKDIEWGHVLAETKINTLPYLTLHRGFNYIIGESGGGKTSLLLALSGLNHNSSYSLDKGEGTPAISKEELISEMVFVSQHTLLAGTCIGDAIMMGKWGGQENREKIERLLQYCFSYLTLQTKVTGLSGGQIKLVALCRALNTGKTLILLDEVLSGLDVATAVRIISFCKEHFSNRTFLLITHDRGLLEKDRVLEV